MPFLLAQRSEHPFHLRPLLRCYDCLAEGMQILDDLEDVRGDFRAGRRNIIIAAVLEDHPDLRILPADRTLPRLPADFRVLTMR